MPYSKSSDHIIPTLFKNCDIPQKPPRSQQQPSGPHGIRIQFLIVPHQSWMVKAPIALWNLAESIKHENFNVNVFMALLDHSIGDCLLMARLGHLGSLKLKRKSN